MTHSRRPSTPVVLTASLFVAVMLSLSGCSGSGSTAAPASGSPGGTSSATAPATSPAATTASDGGGSDGAASAVSAAEFCAALKAERPKLAKLSEVGAMAQLTIAIANVWGKKDALPSLGATDLDALAKSCPDDAAAVLKSAGVASFSAL